MGWSTPDSCGRRSRLGWTETLHTSEAEQVITRPPKHLLASGCIRDDVIDDVNVLLNAIRDRTVVRAENDVVDATHLDRGPHPDRVEAHCVDEDVRFEVIRRFSLVLVHLVDRGVLDPVLVQMPVEVETAQDRSQVPAHVDNQYLQLQLRVFIDRTCARTIPLYTAASRYSDMPMGLLVSRSAYSATK
jgi:hypothetical protein